MIRKWAVRAFAVIVYTAAVVLVWAVLGSSHEGPVPGELVMLRMTWPLLVGLALPLIVFMGKAWSLETRLARALGYDADEQLPPRGVDDLLVEVAWYVRETEENCHE